MANDRIQHDGITPDPLAVAEDKSAGKADEEKAEEKAAKEKPAEKLAAV